MISVSESRFQCSWQDGWFSCLWIPTEEHSGQNHNSDVRGKYTKKFTSIFLSCFLYYLVLCWNTGSNNKSLCGSLLAHSVTVSKVISSCFKEVETWEVQSMKHLQHLDWAYWYLHSCYFISFLCVFDGQLRRSTDQHRYGWGFSPDRRDRAPPTSQVHPRPSSTHPHPSSTHVPAPPIHVPAPPTSQLRPPTSQLHLHCSYAGKRTSSDQLRYSCVVPPQSVLKPALLRIWHHIELCCMRAAGLQLLPQQKCCSRKQIPLLTFRHIQKQTFKMIHAVGASGWEKALSTAFMVQTFAECHSLALFPKFPTSL